MVLYLMEIRGDRSVEGGDDDEGGGGGVLLTAAVTLLIVMMGVTPLTEALVLVVTIWSRWVC